MNKTLMIGGVAICSLIATAALAAGHLSKEQETAVKARNSHMTLFSFNLGPLGAMAQDKAPYDAARATVAANNLAALAAVDQTGYWLEGTDVSVIEGGRAKMEIWTDTEGFAAATEKLATASAALAAVAGDGPDAMKAAFGPVGQACGACHEDYRAPRE